MSHFFDFLTNLSQKISQYPRQKKLIPTAKIFISQAYKNCHECGGI